ncbi:SPFH domain-containing protein [Actimicrobium sp. CCI2.3]|uniref:SPFH domain-containing protein n=1 Tax=Actimicrobium sp. CCI2.3 TaxID=3048616 RepID=UPI002AB49A5E|nr:SPFH domain-containing protein [Actimicrobium sp. CCI2.3]MDY7574470.1 SPFH domain-containing protein [Actimicrobium sp. CCI2.3]MEB0022452.1 SPFH domain-containing protein [Actimicrobium sp. CCI2.3]
MNLVIIVLVVGLFAAASGLRIVRQYEQAIVFRLGRYIATRKAGLFWLIPVIDKQTGVDMRTVTASVDKQETITADNVPVQVTVVIWYTIVRAEQSVIAVVNARDSVIQVALTTLRNIIGQHSLDEVLKDQEKLGVLMKDTIDQATEP